MSVGLKHYFGLIVKCQLSHHSQQVEPFFRFKENPIEINGKHVFNRHFYVNVSIKFISCFHCRTIILVVPIRLTAWTAFTGTLGSEVGCVLLGVNGATDPRPMRRRRASKLPSKAAHSVGVMPSSSRLLQSLRVASFSKSR